MIEAFPFMIPAAGSLFHFRCAALFNIPNNTGSELIPGKARFGALTSFGSRGLQSKQPAVQGLQYRRFIGR